MLYVSFGRGNTRDGRMHFLGTASIFKNTYKGTHKISFLTPFISIKKRDEEVNHLSPAGVRSGYFAPKRGNNAVYHLSAEISVCQCFSLS